MPRKVQYSREIIIDAAIEMVRAKGADSINARDLGEWLGCSSRPLFTAFRNMEELIDAVRMEVSQRFLQRVRAARDANSPIPAAKRMGMCIVQFAQNEPNLYKFIHWTGEQMLDVKELSQIMATQYQTDYQLSDDDALAFFDHMMIFNMGSMLADYQRCTPVHPRAGGADTLRAVLRHTRLLQRRQAKHRRNN